MISDVEKQILFSKQPSLNLAGLFITFFGILIIIVVLVILLVTGNTTSIFDFSKPHLNLPFWIPGVAGILMVIIGGISLWINRSKKRKYLNIMRKGTLHEGVIFSNAQNFYYKVNGIPERVVKIKSDGEVYEYRFFGEEWAQIFIHNGIIKFRTNSKGQALPDPGFMQDLFDKDETHEASVSGSFSEGATKMMQAGDKMLAGGDQESALSFYESAYDFEASAEIKAKIIALATEMGNEDILKKYQ